MYDTPMSKTQDKKKSRIAEAAQFVKERRTIQYHLIKSNFDVGVSMYNANKEKLSAEEDTLLQEEMVKQRELIEKFKEDFGIEA